MKRFLTALAPAALIALSSVAPAAAEKLSLSTLSTYLNSLGTVRADFVQTNDDGSKSSGEVTIKRPGRMRLDYGGDNDALVLVSGGQVAVFDPGSNEPPQRFPLSQTPLSVILKRNVDLNAAKMVVSHREQNGDTIVRAQDPDHPDYGYIDLIFSATPVLKAWVIHDQGGGSTTVQLTKMSLGGSVADRTFNIRAEANRRGTPID
ncbi:outer membrane lipoprotein carrier protein LolA [Celeribacter halophilus]|jgi:outer membrane lipoprotein-sorting protein|uniref:Outer membrane lipoprotein carrier protein LolA n=1 Tax=Celeribacter halophilus TaxID=576117 RepID=A0AAW7XTI9_9RHOB|nr:outer membrane lipoprotein carrier protein LolA [Celeribacter halophilus]MDO6457706.1 outer membrane lipoprotein carrier protein LolA [Celeribacter halophilus]MDO6723964.1 outer membrane lipoprotein carrier protein LolA [Celeribacter halophilus]